jgi:hypothetical protein
VKAWTPDPTDYHQGRPTRKARLRYITRNLHVVFGGFLQADVHAAIEFLEIFQKGTHDLESKLTLEEIALLRTRVEGLLRFLLVIHATAGAS